jgi:hypothetical protein
MGNRNPKRVVDAMTATAVTVAGITLRPVTASTMLILQKLDSPLTRAEPGEKPEMSDMDTLRLVFALSHPAQECFALANSGGFDEAAVAAGDAIPVAELPAVGAAINRLFDQAFSTILAEKKTAAPKTTHSAPSAPASGATAGS